ncbi:hypothetical protein L596_024441 [Steinernema carpocapsae]|uniref:ubiquitinyl hydrolase 1 n=1 Tax=Steinernema carpocapsae TaxID=34508 RepID=A0A4U5MGR9_STECR|nr:hypothetical protein L596_024441 [Steinernema carpocapsae]
MLPGGLLKKESAPRRSLRFVALDPKSFAYMNSITLDALLRKYFSPEVISDASCDDCKSKFNRKNSGLLKKQGFYKLPQTLVIRIERIAYNPSGASYKRPEHIAFPAVLDVRDHCFHVSREGEYARGEAINNIAQNLLPTVVPETSNASSNDVPKTLSMVQNICNTLYGKNFKYELRAVSEHLGGPDSGHFITYRKALDDENTWFRTSDSCVTRVAFSAVATSQAYLLIYDKIIHSKIPVKVSEDILMD